MNSKEENKDIDLIKVLVDFIKLLKRRIYLIIIIEIIFVIGSILYFKSYKNDKIYKKSFVITSDYVSDYFLEIIIHSIFTLDKRNAFKKQEFKKGALSFLKSIKTEVKTFNDGKTYLQCDFKFSKKEYGVEIEREILSFIKKNEFIKDKYQIEINYKINLIKVLDEKISKFNFENTQLIENNGKIKNSSDLILYNLNKEKEELEKDLKNKKEFDLISSCEIIEEKKLSQFQFTFLSIVVGFFTSLFLSYILKVFSKVKKRYLLID